MSANVARDLKQEMSALRFDLGESREILQDLLGFEDQVKGFDLDMVTDENIDFLDIYAEFLG
jgi:hypothetical protein